jgi:hypothetical protein
MSLLEERDSPKLYVLFSVFCILLVTVLLITSKPVAGETRFEYASVNESLTTNIEQCETWTVVAGYDDALVCTEYSPEYPLFKKDTARKKQSAEIKPGRCTFSGCGLFGIEICDSIVMLQFVDGECLVRCSDGMLYHSSCNPAPIPPIVNCDDIPNPCEPCEPACCLGCRPDPCGADDDDCVPASTDTLYDLIHLLPATNFEFSDNIFHADDRPDVAPKCPVELNCDTCPNSGVFIEAMQMCAQF